MSIGREDFIRLTPYEESRGWSQYDQFEDLASRVIPLAHNLAHDSSLLLDEETMRQQMYDMSDQENRGHSLRLGIYGLQDQLSQGALGPAVPTLHVPHAHRQPGPRQPATPQLLDPFGEHNAQAPVITAPTSCPIPSREAQPFLVALALETNNLTLLTPPAAQPHTPMAAYTNINHRSFVNRLVYTYEDNEPFALSSLPPEPFYYGNVERAFAAAPPGPAAFGELIVRCADAPASDAKRNAMLGYALQGPIQAIPKEHGAALLKIAKEADHPAYVAASQQYHQG